jgi:hypothetical protein
MTNSKNDQNATPAVPTSPNPSVDPTRKVFVGTNAELNLILERRKSQSKQSTNAPSSGASPSTEIERATERPSESEQSTNPSPSGASPSTEIERATERPSESGQSTNASSSGANTSRKSGNTNALRHGAYSYGLLPWESLEDFKALLESFREYWKPHGAAEEDAVLTLTQWTWKRRRVLQGSQISYYRSPAAESLKSGEVSWDDVVRHQSKVPEEIQALISNQLKLVKSLNSLSDRIGEHHYWTSTSEGKDIQFQLAKMRSDIGTLASKVREDAFDENKNLKMAVEEITTLFDHAYQPEEIEKQVKLLSMIDREIDKAIKRLIFLKTYKSVEAADEARKVGALAQPLVEAPPTIPNEAPTVEEKVKVNESAPLRGNPD